MDKTEPTKGKLKTIAMNTEKIYSDLLSERLLSPPKACFFNENREVC